MFLFTLFLFSLFFWLTVFFIIWMMTGLVDIFRVSYFQVVIANQILTIVAWCIDRIHHFVFIIWFSISLIISIIDRIYYTFSIHFTIISFANSSVSSVYFIRLFSLLLYFSFFCLGRVLSVFILTRLRFRVVAIVGLIWAFSRYIGLNILSRILMMFTYIF